MGLRLIHGYLHNKQKAKPEWGNVTLTETVLIEMENPSSRTVDVIMALPAYPAAPSEANPKGLSFTFDLSPHPDAPTLVLRTAGDLVQVDGGGCFWTVELSYAVFSTTELSGGFAAASGSNNHNPKKRKDQKEFVNPVDRPVVWNMSTSLVSKQTYVRAAQVGGMDVPIIHANGLPITEPYTFEEAHETHNFSYNIDYSTFDHDDFDNHVGKVDSGNALGLGTGKVKFTGFTANEEYESNGEALERTTYHYVRVTLSFEYNPSGWARDYKLVSMSTVQLVAGELIPINISPTEYAQEPWPLLDDGTAAQYDALDATMFALVDHGYPRTINLEAVADSNPGQGKKELVIP